MIVAEIGWNFLGDMDLAKKMVLSAKNVGCKYVKFQLWHRAIASPNGHFDIYYLSGFT